MKITIKNFKSIGNLEEFELRPLTILSGNNSSGKSSFLQLLLILKQTLDISSSKKQIFIRGDYYIAKNQTDLIKAKDIDRELTIEFSISKAEFGYYGNLIQKSIYDGFPNYTCNLNLLFSFVSNDLQLKRFHLEYVTEIKNEYLTFERNISGQKFKIDTNNFSYFLSPEYLEDEQEEDKLQITKEILKVNYSSFFPISYVELIRTIGEDPKGEKMHFEREAITRINSNSVKSFLDVFFRELYYIGPLRIEPKDSYAGNPEKNWVGTKGEFTAQLLESKQGDEIECYLPKINGDTIRFHKEKLSLLEATNIWVCDVFRFAKQLFVRETGENYSVFLVNDEDIEISLKHVGFGISQILPIVIQGLLMEKGSTLILEQPEIHLHPKIQSSLFDFLHSLILDDKKFIVETHSDHFITRLRRRVAEDESSKLQDQINLTFIQREGRDLSFRKVKLNDVGVYDIFPDDFIENPEKELMALLNAQMRKRKFKKEKR